MPVQACKPGPSYLLVSLLVTSAGFTSSLPRNSMAGLALRADRRVGGCLSGLPDRTGRVQDSRRKTHSVCAVSLLTTPCSRAPAEMRRMAWSLAGPVSAHTHR